MSPCSSIISEFSINAASVTIRLFNPENPEYHQDPGNTKTWEQWVGWTRSSISHKQKGCRGVNTGSVEEEHPVVLSLVIDGRGGQKSRRKMEVATCDQKGNSTLCKAMRLSLKQYLFGTMTSPDQLLSSL